MVRAMGLNLTEALADGRLCHDGYAGLIASCASCDFVAECCEWLATPVGDTPDFCALKPALSRIAEKG